MTLDINWPTTEELLPRGAGLTVSNEAAGSILLAAMSLLNASFGRLALASDVSATPPHIICAVDGCIGDTQAEYNPTENLAMMHCSSMKVFDADARQFFTPGAERPIPCQLLVSPIAKEDKRFGVVTLGIPFPNDFRADDPGILQDFCSRFAQLISMSGFNQSSISPMNFMRSHPFFVNIPWPMLIIDRQEIIQELNRSAETLFGCFSGEMSGNTLSSVILDTDNASRGEEIFIKRADGVPVPVELTRSPLSFLGQGCDVTLIVLRDLSRERQLLEQQVKSAELAGIFNTIATVNHEINNPLFGMIATTQLLKNDLKDSTPSVQKKLDRIAECCERIQSITENLSRVIRPARRTYAADEGMLDLTRATSPARSSTAPGESPTPRAFG